MTTAGWPAGRSGGGEQIRSVVDELAERLQRSVVVNDPSVHQLYASRHFDDADGVRIRAVLQHDAGDEVVAHVLAQGVARWSGPGPLAAAPHLDLLRRWCAPLRAGGRFLGTLMVIDAHDDLTGAEHTAIAEAAAAIAAHLHGVAVAANAARGDRDALCEDLFSADRGRREATARTLSALGFPARPHIVVTVLEVSTTTHTLATHTTAEVELALRGVQSNWENSPRLPAISSVTDRRAQLAQHWLTEPRPEQLRAEADGIRAGLRRSLGPDAGCVIGVSDPATATEDLRGAYHQARIALRAAHTLHWAGGVGLWSELGAYAPLLCLTEAVPPSSCGARALAALRAHDAGPRLIDTLRVYLDHAGSAPATAKLLNLHRTSLYYRLTQIRQITGLDLDSGADRLALHIQLRLDEITGQ